MAVAAQGRAALQPAQRQDWIFDRPNHVYVIAADGTGTPRNLTPGAFQHSGISWLRDSSGIVTSAQRHDTWDRDRASDLYVVSLPEQGDAREDASNVRAVTARDGLYDAPSVSPDGTLVAFIGSADPGIYPQNAKVGILPIDGSAHPHTDIRWLSTGLDRTFQPTVGSRAPVWESDTHLLATAEDRGATHLYRIPADGSFVPEPLTEGPVSVTSFDAASGVVARAQESATHPAELYVNDVRRARVAAVHARRRARLGAVLASRPPTAPARSTRGSCARPGSTPSRPIRSCSTCTEVRTPSTANCSSTKPRCRRPPGSSSS